jgi:xanthine/uracil permease
MIHDSRSTDAFLGLGATSLGLITSVQEQFEYGLRITSLMIGVLIGLISLYRMLRKKKSR